jgi:hypothetical protein
MKLDCPFSMPLISKNCEISSSFEKIGSPGVYFINYFINILRAHVAPIFWRQKLQSCILGLKFFGAKISAQNVDEIDTRMNTSVLVLKALYGRIWFSSLKKKILLQKRLQANPIHCITQSRTVMYCIKF